MTDELSNPRFTPEILASQLTIRPVQWRDPEVGQLVDALDQYQISLYGVASCNLESVNLLERSNAYAVGAISSESVE